MQPLFKGQTIGLALHQVVFNITLVRPCDLSLIVPWVFEKLKSKLTITCKISIFIVYVKKFHLNMLYVYSFISDKKHFFNVVYLCLLKVFESFWGIEFLFPFNLPKHPDKLCGPKIFSVLPYFWLDLCLVPSVQKNAATVKSRFVNIWWIHNVGVKFLLWEIFWWNSRYLTFYCFSFLHS